MFMLNALMNNSLRFYSGETGEKSEKSSETQNQESTEQNEEQNTQNEETPLSEEEKKIVSLSEELGKVKDSYARCLADQENTRRIARQDVDNAKEYSVTKFAKNMLDVVDNLDRALSVMHPEDLEKFMSYFQEHHDEDLKKKASQMKSIVTGVQLTRKVMMKALESHGITQIPDSTAQKFDPEYHEALMKQPVSDEDKDKVGHVAHVINQGFTIKDRVLRPAKVVVFVDPDAE
eukprot:CAMPEP_0117443402 /NCGR_PEP_ID=MMETSP0759-20121206/4676_1 /TAXON_ID=63605 /ORGANISM="Percolomonas cosmopolitus, Strain WS" /LENGTH=232 /DNA_ID=CAMNT_0005235375 /DNA_START=220 /DNA_END=918 /DNA_ORIENTATION=+